MNVEAYNLIIETISKLLDSKNFKPVDTETGAYFTNGELAVRVVFDQSKELFNLEQTTMAGEIPAEDWKVLSGWLFSADSNLKDAQSIGNDFEDSLREFLGVKPSLPTATTAAKATPTKGNPGDDPTPTMFAGRFLTIFPQFKEQYDQYVTADGAFLYVLFGEEIAGPHLGELLDNDDKKRLVKYFALLNDVFCNGTKDARAMVPAVILNVALRGNDARMETAQKYLKETHPYLSAAAIYAVKAKEVKGKPYKDKPAKSFGFKK